MTRMNKLKARVDAQNLANRTANEMYGPLAEAFRPLIGQKVLKADGSFTEKVKKLLPPEPKIPGVRIIHNGSHGSLSWAIDASVPIEGSDLVGGGHICVYEKTTLYVGNVQDCVLVDVVKPAPERTDYTVDEVLAARKAFDDARDAYNAARSALAPFGDSDG